MRIESATSVRGGMLGAIAMLVATCATHAIAAPARGDAPRVVETVPAHGAVNVDPALDEIRVVFDRDMSTGGYSFTGGGDDFPAVAAKPRWIDARTCVLPVRLRPGQACRIGLNSASARNFRAADGTPLPARPLWFRVRPEAGPEAPDLAEGDGAAFAAALRAAIDLRYSYRDRLGVDWDARFAAFAPRLEGARHRFTLACAAGELLAATEDPHVKVRLDGAGLPVWGRGASDDMCPPCIDERLVEASFRSATVLLGRLPADVVYLRIDALGDDLRAAMPELQAKLDRILSGRALIVDLRGNGGGSEDLGAAIAGRFVREPVVYATHRWRDPTAPDGFGPVVRRVLEPVAVPESTRPTLVVGLIGPVTLSSAEAFALQLRAAGAVLLGQPTGGSSGNPAAVTLPGEIEVVLPRWVAMDADGTPFEGRGIAPDELVGPGTARGVDPDLAAAETLIAARREGSGDR